MTTDQAKTRSQADGLRADFKMVMKRHVAGESLDAIGLDLDPQMNSTQIRRAIGLDPEMTAQFNSVIEGRAHWMIEQCAELAGKCAKVGDVAGMKAAMDSYLKLAAKIAPGLYGDKATLELVGAGGGPVKHVVSMSPEDAYKAALGGAAK